MSPAEMLSGGCSIFLIRIKDFLVQGSLQSLFVHAYA